MSSLASKVRSVVAAKTIEVVGALGAWRTIDWCWSSTGGWSDKCGTGVIEAVPQCAVSEPRLEGCTSPPFRVRVWQTAVALFDTKLNANISSHCLYLYVSVCIYLCWYLLVFFIYL